MAELRRGELEAGIEGKESLKLSSFVLCFVCAAAFFPLYFRLFFIIRSGEILTTHLNRTQLVFMFALLSGFFAFRQDKTCLFFILCHRY